MIDVTLPADTQAILLLCGYFGKEDRSAKPLALREYNALAAWLRREHLRPADLLHEDGEAQLQRFHHDTLTQERLRALLGRGVTLGFTVEEWTRQGVWVVSRGEEAYPSALKERLRASAPPLLYGVGDQALLETGQALGMVGSRNADDEALALTREVAERCAEEQIMVISGGARGVDQVSMFSALEAGGAVLAVLAEGVAKPAVSKKYRAHLAEGRLTLVSPYHPKARWTVGNAMGRNKYIYAFSDWTLAVSAGTKGGTWSGAIENLKQGWVPLLVRAGEAVPEGNRKLLERGAIAFHPVRQRNTPRLLDYLRSTAHAVPSGDGVPDLFSAVRSSPSQPARDASQIQPEKIQPESRETPTPEIGDLFPVVWPSLALALNEERTHKEMAKMFGDMQQGQMRTWLQQAVDRNLVEKRTRPVRYVIKEQSDQ